MLRHPHKIHIGDNVVIDDNCLLDAKGEAQRRHPIGSGVFVGRNTILSCKNGDIELADEANVGFNCEIFSASRVRVGRGTLVAAYVYLIGGDHEFSDPRKGRARSAAASSPGISVGAGAWLGAGATILDGVTIGDRAVVGAGAVVRDARAGGRDGRRHPARGSSAEPSEAERARWPSSPIVTSAPPLTEGGHLVLARVARARARRGRPPRGHRHDAVESIRPARRRRISRTGSPMSA